MHGSLSISVVTVWYHSRYHSSSAYRQSMHSPGLVDEKSFKKRKDSQAKKKKKTRRVSNSFKLKYDHVWDLSGTQS